MAYILGYKHFWKHKFLTDKSVLIPRPDTELVIEETLNFDFPIIPISGSISSLELFQGPTLAFKDVGARFMARCLAYAHEVKEQKKLTILVATSGDTGGAVADGFFKVEGIDVVILYPKGKVSEVQEKQMTTLGQNIIALEVDGTFDDCQNMVKSVSNKFPNLVQTWSKQCPTLVQTWCKYALE